jgi:hypothetical protein
MTQPTAPHDWRYVPLLMLLLPYHVRADGIVVDQIYDPYVQSLETEIELRSIIQSDDAMEDAQKHSLGFGRSLSDRWALEIYAIGTKTGSESLSVNAFEVEAKWQLTEQGEYAFDWGMLFEVERESDDKIWEASAALISSRDFGRWTGTANLGVVYEWGSGIDNEIETVLRVQARYRLKESFEPAIELHAGQGSKAMGPALAGLLRLSPGRKFRWDAGVFFGLDNDSADQTIKLNLEYEF